MHNYAEASCNTICCTPNGIVMAKKPKYEDNFSDLFDEVKTPEPTSEKAFNRASQTLADEAMERIYTMMTDPDSADYVRLAAAKLILAYGRGTPVKKSETVVSTPQIRPIILSGEIIEDDEPEQ